MDNESKYHYGREIICTLRSCTAISERVYLHWLDKINDEEKLKSHNSEYVEINGTDWICEKCGQTVDGRNLTFEEIHEGCGGKCH